MLEERQLVNNTCSKQELSHHEFDDLEAVLEGVGRDAEIVTNEQGGKQSKTPMALHLVDPNFLIDWVNNAYTRHNIDICESIKDIAKFMNTGDKSFIGSAIKDIEFDYMQQLVRIAKVLQYGADRYEANNWRLIPQESHINHALIHLIAHLSGDTQDDHLDHALCRLMMAYATDVSEGFDYNRYIPTVGTIVETATSHPDFKLINKLQEEYDKFICKYKYDCDYKE